MVAVKKFDGNCPKQLKNDFEQEIDILKKIKHKNIVMILGYNDKRHNTYIVNEYMNGGSLFEYIKENSKIINWKKDFNLISDMVNAMSYLHENNIVHLDLKSLNVLLNNDQTTAKISDFGLAKITSITSSLSNFHSVQSGKIAKGTIRYMSPEVSKGNQGSYESDVWSFGCILLEIATREIPFYALGDAAVFALLQNDTAKLPINLTISTPKIISVIIYKCLNKNSENRPSFDEIKEILTEINENLLKDTIATNETNSATKVTISPHTIKTRSNLKSLLNYTKKNMNESNLEKKIVELEDKLSELQIKLKFKNNVENNHQVSNQTTILSYQLAKYLLDSTPKSAIEEKTKMDNLLNKTPIDVTKPKSISGVWTGETYVSQGSRNGRPIFEGPRGGKYILTNNGNKSYLPKTSSSSISATVDQYGGVSTGSSYVSNGSANGRTIFEGPRGGKYYLTASGNKRYV